MKAKVLTSLQINNDIKAILDEIFNRTGGTDYFEIGGCDKLADLPKNISKLYTWYINKPHEFKGVYESITKSYGLSDSNYKASWKYLYAFETEAEN